MIVADLNMVLNDMETLKLNHGLPCIVFPQKTNSSQVEHVRVPTEHDDREEGKDVHLLRL